jgi:hypothetical protein
MVLGMVDITEISAVVAAAGVLVGVALTVLELRHFFKQRQTQLVVELSSQTRSREYKEATMETLSADFNDYNDFVKKYGAPFSKTQFLSRFQYSAPSTSSWGFSSKTN